MRSVNARNKIFRTGFMGSGKTSVGRLLSGKMDVPFVDLDERIKRRSGMSISAIFRLKGEEYFRKLESTVLQSLCRERGRIVISTGGGAVLNPANIRLMRKNGRIVYLRVSAVQAVERLSGDKSRPLLRRKDSLKTARELMRARKPFYARYDLAVNTCGKSVMEITRKIFQKLG